MLLAAILPLSALVATQLVPAAVASDAAAGAAVFELKCAACHGGGSNLISPGRDLKAKSLEANGYATEEALAALVAVGKGQMPSYGPKSPPFARLTEEQISDVSAYVLSQAAAGWPSGR